MPKYNKLFQYENANSINSELLISQQSWSNNVAWKSLNSLSLK